MKSLTYHLTMLFIKIKGIKTDFSRDPIDFKKLRKEDIHFPKLSNAKQFRIENTLVTEIPQTSLIPNLIIFIHGGAFVYGPAKHHWAAVNKLQAATKTTIWMVDYPKAPENKIGEISQNVNLVYEAALKRAALGKIILIGDSVGGTLITALAQRLITNHSPLPSLIVLISPVMDASFKNENISFLEKADPVLSKNGVLSAKTMCADEGNLEDPAISPINGKFTGFPYTVLFIAEHDITSPDQELLVLKLRKAKVLHRIYRGKAMPHIWPLLPVMQESKLAFQNMVAEINQKLN